MVENSIDLDPEYQRDVVLVRLILIPFRLELKNDLFYFVVATRPETKQIGLIDSLLRNYYVPPVIFGRALSYRP